MKHYQRLLFGILCFLSLAVLAGCSDGSNTINSRFTVTNVDITTVGLNSSDNFKHGDISYAGGAVSLVLTLSNSSGIDTSKVNMDIRDMNNNTLTGGFISIKGFLISQNANSAIFNPSLSVPGNSTASPIVYTFYIQATDKTGVTTNPPLIVGSFKVLSK